MDAIIPPHKTTAIAAPLFIAYLLNWGLYGISLMQTYVYFIRFDNDTHVLKTLVYSVFLLETTETVLLTYCGYMDFVTGFGDLQGLNTIRIGWIMLPIVTGLVTFAAQSFYAYRIRVLSQSRLIPVVILFLTVVQLGGAVATSVVVKEARVFSNLLGHKSYITATVWEAGSALCDVVIAVCMTYYLRTRDSNISQTHVILTKLIRLIVGTGTLTAAVAVLTLVMTYLPNRPTYYQTTSTVLGKVYFNSMLVLLNSRKGGVGTYVEASEDSHELRFATTNNLKGPASRPVSRLIQHLPGLEETTEEGFDPPATTIRQPSRRYDNA